MIVRSVEDLRAVVAKKAGTREFYRAAVLGLPWSFSCPLHPPVKAAEFLSAWPEVRAWAQAWLRPSPYWTVETTVRQVGRGTRVGQSTLPHFPSRVCIASVEQALGFLRDEKAFQAYAHAVRPLVTAFPALEPVCLTPAFRKAVGGFAGGRTVFCGRQPHGLLSARAGYPARGYEIHRAAQGSHGARVFCAVPG